MAPQRQHAVEKEEGRSENFQSQSAGSKRKKIKYMNKQREEDSTDCY
jgi:hypothetical protein